jgi:hypothetical protein
MLARALLRATARQLPRAAATLPPVAALRPLSAAATAPGGAPGGADNEEEPHPFLLEVLRVSAWRVAPPALVKRFEFRTPRDAGRFDAQVRDLSLRTGRLPGLRLEGACVDVTIPYSPRRAAAGGGAGGSGGTGDGPTAADVGLAQAVDDVGAELQLAGKWGAG